MGQITSKTKSGFEFEVDERLFEDYRLSDAIGMSTSDNPMDRIKSEYQLMMLVLGEEGKKKLFEHLAEDNGFINKKRVTEEFAEIMTFVLSQNKAKN